jgi:hypothetical protein
VVDALADLERQRVAVPTGRPLRDQAPEVGLEGLAVRGDELRQVVVAERHPQVAHLGDAQGRIACLGQLREHRPHLGGGLQEELLGVELQPAGVGLHLGLLDAEQDVVGGGMALVGVMRVVRGDERDAHLLRELDQPAVGRPLLLDAVLHDLEEEVLGPDDVPVLRRGTFGGIHPAGHDHLGGLPGQAPGQDDQAFGVLGEELLVDAGAGEHAGAEVALEPAARHELHEVAVAGLVLGQHGQVAVGLLALLAVAVEARPRGDVGLDAHDGLDTCRDPRVEEVQRPVHRAVIGDREGRHLVLGGAREELADPAGPVQQRELAVHVQVDEAGVRSHPSRQSLPRGSDTDAVCKSCGLLTRL